MDEFSHLEQSCCSQQSMEEVDMLDTPNLPDLLDTEVGTNMTDAVDIVGTADYIA